MTTSRGFAGPIALLIIFAALAKGAHDIWAATVVYLAVLFMAGVLFLRAAFLPDQKLRVPLRWPLLGLLAAFTLSFVMASNPSEAFLGWMDWCCMALLFFIAANVFRSGDAVDLLLRMIVPLIWLEAGFLAFQTLPHWWNYREWPEAPGTIINANFVSAFLVFWVLPLFDRVAASGKSGRDRWFWISGLAACVSALVLAQSLWAWLLVASAFCVRSSKRRGTYFGMAVAAVAVGLLAWKIYFGRSPIDRFAWWNAAFNMFRDNLWWGAGIGNYPSAYLSYREETALNTLYAHSIWLGLLAETGIIGAAAVLVFFGAFFRRTQEKGPFFFGAVLFLLYGSVGLGTEALVNLLVLGLFMGVAAARMEGPAFQPRKSAAIVVAGLILCSIPYLVSPFMASRYFVDGTEKSFFSAIELDPRSWEPYAGLARLAFERGEIRLAVEFQQKALNRNRLSLPLKRRMEDYRRVFLRTGRE